MNLITSEQIELYCSLFRGRQDVYARRWEKNGKSGYSPAYDFNWSEFLAFKSRGGTLGDFPNKRAHDCLHNRPRVKQNYENPDVCLLEALQPINNAGRANKWPTTRESAIRAILSYCAHEKFRLLTPVHNPKHKANFFKKDFSQQLHTFKNNIRKRQFQKRFFTHDKCGVCRH